MYMDHLFVILNAIILSVTVVLCFIVMLLLVQDTKTKSVTKRFLLSLCISDLLHVVLGSGFLIHTGSGLKLSDASCSYEVALFGVSLIVTLFVTVVTSLDRYFAIGHPLKYQTTMTDNLSLIVIGINWTLVLLVGSLNMIFQRSLHELPVTVQENLNSISCVFVKFTIQEEFLNFLNLGIIFPSIMVIVVTNIRIYMIMKRVHKAIAHRISFIYWIKSNFENGKQQANSLKGPLKRREIRATFVLLLTVTIFVIIWTPMILFRIVQLFERSNSNELTETFVYTILTGLQLHSVINPFLYIFTMKHHKEALQKLLAKVFCCKSKVSTANEDGMNK